MAATITSPLIVYRKLTGLHRGFGMMSQLWLGGDHLLHLTSTGYTETYRRCYLREIQSLLIVHTARRTYIAIILAVLMWIIGMIMLMKGSGWVGYAILAAAFAPFFVWNYLLGTGCRVVMITAVQQERVASLCRLPKTRRVITELKPLIEAAQVELTMPPLEESVVEASAAPLPVKIPPLLPPPLPPPLPST
ncbi:MAG TPA: hypothetical protein VGM64_22045 [Lacunisphaera sp.]|jgi:hypothetical protein